MPPSCQRTRNQNSWFDEPAALFTRRAIPRSNQAGIEIPTITTFATRDENDRALSFLSPHPLCRHTSRRRAPIFASCSINALSFAHAHSFVSVCHVSPHPIHHFPRCSNSPHSTSTVSLATHSLAQYAASFSSLRSRPSHTQQPASQDTITSF
jgi:hypothetical protein